jgi:hypothetical protein
MSTITFECQVTEYDITPPITNDELIFALNKKSLIINLMDSHNEKILMQTEIDRNDAIELAKLILHRYL